MGRPKLDGSNLTIKISEKVQERLARLQERTDAASATEVIRRALELYETILSQEGKLFSKTKDGAETMIVIT